jgi:thiol-disulfide isomerase/thioredoxin
LGERNIRLNGRLPLILSMIIILILFQFSGCQESDSDDMNSNTEGINFLFTTLDGEEKQLSDYYGKIIILDLMGVNCQPCFYQMFELEKISENYSSNDLTIISIDVWVTYGEDVELLNTYINYLKEEFDLGLSWLFGLDDTDGTIFHQYSNKGVPMIYILDQNGNIYYAKESYHQYSALAEKINEIIK